jgi:hypothetical protein
MNNFYLALGSILLIALIALVGFVSKKLGALRDPLQIWEALNNVGLLPIRMRAWIFSTLVGIANPYSKSINFRITELRKGKSCGVMKVKKTMTHICPRRTCVYVSLSFFDVFFFDGPATLPARQGC